MANEYSGSDMLHMQQDAIRRVKEMQRRANEKVRQGNSQASTIVSHTSFDPSDRPTSRETKNTQLPANQNQSSSGSLTGILDRIGIDNEKAVLLLLIILMLNEGADTKLILALCYLLI